MTDDSGTISSSAKSIERILSEDLNVRPAQIMAAIRLLDNGATVPFIARYRKEETGNLSDTHLRMLFLRLEELRELERRKQTVLEAAQKQGLLTEELKLKIESTNNQTALEDLYRPFKPKVQSKSKDAYKAGLEGLADCMMERTPGDINSLTQGFINPEKNIHSIEEALDGAFAIIQDWADDEAELISELRDLLRDNAVLRSQKSLEAPDESKYRDYYDYEEALIKVPSHRALAMLRGRNEKLLRLKIALAENSDVNNDDFIEIICDYFGVPEEIELPVDAYLREFFKKYWNYKLKVRLEMDLMMELKKRSEDEAIRVFASNLEDLLMAPPAGAKKVMGLDPGFQHGVKGACIDASGAVETSFTLYPHPPKNQWRESVQELIRLIDQLDIDLIAIGNGTASRETDLLVTEALKSLPADSVKKVVISEDGASVYSASETAADELPDMDVSLRGAVSIARRLQDPLAELVKIDPKSIGVGQYQHDLNQRKLTQTLRTVVESCVNRVGAELNTASAKLLGYIAGIGEATAKSIVEYRQVKGLFKERKDLLNVRGISEKVYEQCAGFLRIHNGLNPLDASGVHPESYSVVESIIRRYEKTLDQLIGNTQLIKNIPASDFTDDRFGLLTVKDILSELDKPGRDPRSEFKQISNKEHLRDIKDLKQGMILEGRISNVADFGAFVDLGIHQDGLVHISEMKQGFTKDPHSIVHTGDIVKVKVLDVDVKRGRIALSMILGSNPLKKKASFGNLFR